MLQTADIPLSAEELLDFEPASFLCLAVLAAVGIGLFFLFEKGLRIKRKDIFRLFFLSLYCFVCATGIFWNDNRQEHSKRLEWAERIASPRDTVFEKDFARIAWQIRHDTVLQEFSRRHREPDFRENFSSLIQNRYFTPAFPDYLCFFTFCEPQEQLLIDAETTADCQDFFEQKALKGMPTRTESLRVMDYGIEYYAYLYRTCWAMPGPQGSSSPEEDTLFLYMEAGRKKFSDQPGSPGLHLPNQYSYAFYSNGNLWSHSGDFLYTFRIRENREDSLHFDRWRNYSHLFYPLPESRLLILSTPEPDPWDIFHNFSLLFLVFGLIGVLCLWLTDKNFLGKSGSYAQQLRLSTFALILLVFLIFGGTSLYFMQQWNENENAKLLRNQTLSILTEMEERYLYLPAQEIHDESCGDSVCMNLNADIAQLSNLFRSDIYLYDIEGKLISGPSGFSLIPDSLDSDILHDLTEEQNHLLIRHAEFGNQGNGLLAFTPFRNVQNQILGYFCIPYYMHPDEIKSEMNQFIGTYLDIIVLMTLATLILTYLLAQRITQPLSLIARKVSQIRLTRKNEHLEWKRDDEIGALVKQYNVLVDELESSSHGPADSARNQESPDPDKIASPAIAASVQGRENGFQGETGAFRRNAGRADRPSGSHSHHVLAIRAMAETADAGRFPGTDTGTDLPALHCRGKNRFCPGDSAGTEDRHSGCRPQIPGTDSNQPDPQCRASLGGKRDGADGWRASLHPFGTPANPACRTGRWRQSRNGQGSRNRNTRRCRAVPDPPLRGRQRSRHPD